MSEAQCVGAGSPVILPVVRGSHVWEIGGQKLMIPPTYSSQRVCVSRDAPGGTPRDCMNGSLNIRTRQGGSGR
eukprot:3346354-Prymnesium_polylepis.1